MTVLAQFHAARCERIHLADRATYFGPRCAACNSRRTKRLAQGYPIRQCCEPNCGRSSLYGALVPEKREA